MKKFSLLVFLGMMAMGLCACGKNNAADGTLDSLYSDKYVSLGDYKGVEVTVDLSEPTQEQIQTQIDNDLSSMAEEKEVTGRTVKEGDIVNIDYVGTKDGVAFDGGTASGFDLTIGSGQFIDGFETGLIGASVGDNLDLNLTFPEQYHSEELAGADVVFNVTVNAIKEKITPELTEDIVATMGDYASVEEYKQSVKDNLYNSAMDSAKEDARNQIISMVIENSSIKERPQWLLDQSTESVKNSALSYANMYGMSMEDFVTQVLNETVEEFDIECITYGQKSADQALVSYAIANKEDLKITEDELKEKLDEYMASYGMSEEDMETSGQKNYLTIYLQTEKVAQFLLENAKIVDTNGNSVTF